MKTFSELKTQFDSTTISDPSNITNQEVNNMLSFLAETKYTCESFPNFKYVINSDTFNVRLLRDVCCAGLNYNGHKEALYARFTTAGMQVGAIVN